MMQWLFNWKAAMWGGYYRLIAPLSFRRVGKRARIAGRQKLRRPLINVAMGDDAMLGYDIFWQVSRKSTVEIGDRFSLNSNSFVVISERLSIGNNVAIGEMVSLRDSEHKFDPDHGVRDQGFITAPIVIEDNCWIGRGAYIGPGAHIRRGSIVAAHSVVRGDYPAGSLIAGAPATVKKSLLDSSPSP